MSTGNATYNAFVTQFKADKKKAAALVVVALVMAGVYARLLLKPKAKLESAEAAAVAPTATPPTVSNGDSAPRSEGPAPNSLAAASIRGETLSRQFVRDLFDTDLSIFLPSDETAAKAKLSAATQPTWASKWLRQFSRQMQERSRRAERSRLEIEAEAAKLQLQGTILGPTPKASISGRIVKEGDTIAGFRVMDIGPRHVGLLKSGCHVRLTML